MTVSTIEDLDRLVARVKKAQAEYESYSQEQVDRIFRAAARAAFDARLTLAYAAIQETALGVLEDKVAKNTLLSEYIYYEYKDTKTCGVIEYDRATGFHKIAEPYGVIAAIVPVTNPTSTAIFKCMLALKTRNGMILAPHPRGKGCTAMTAQIILDAAVAEYWLTYPHAKDRYAELADYLKLGGRSKDEKLERLIKAVEKLISDCDLPGTIQKAGVPETAFQENLPSLVALALGDVAAGGNPRMAMAEEVGTLFMTAFYGKLPAAPAAPAEKTPEPEKASAK